MKFDRSLELWERAQRVIPLGTQTFSKSPSVYVQGVSPIYLQRGRGSHVWDVDGNEFVDYAMALGPIILGYAEPVVDAAIRAQLEDGITFSLMHPVEVEVAERMVRLCPGVEAVRFGKSGSDAMAACVRAARAITGRDHVLVAGYHGWHDWYIGTTTRRAGVPQVVQEMTSTFAFNDLDGLGEELRRRPGAVAAVVLEPSGLDCPAPGYLNAVVEMARAEGCISIFDEVITGFRLAPGGARERYGVEPDFSAYGKALGNGMPISAVGGRWEMMQIFEEIFFSGTHGGEALSLAAAGAVLDALADGEVLRHNNRLGHRLVDGVRQLIGHHRVDERVEVTGEPEHAIIGFKDDPSMFDLSFVQQTLAEHGVLFNGSMFICGRHTDDDIDLTLAAFDEALSGLASTTDASTLLKGPAIRPIFRARER